MTMIVSFVDGFTSSSAPNLSGIGTELYTLANNQASLINVSGLLFTGNTSAVGFIEVERIGAVTYRQVIQVNFTYDGTSWSIELGSYDGNDILQTSSITSTEQILLSMSGTQVQYRTGNLASHVSSKIKVSLTRFNV